MELIRAEFGFERWLVVGGSWGATLALAYAQAHPGARQRHWCCAPRFSAPVKSSTAFRRTPAAILSRSMASFSRPGSAPTSAATRSTPIWRRCLDPDPAIHGPAARAWHDYRAGARPSTIRGRTRIDLAALATSRTPADAVLEAHYFHHDGFLAPRAVAGGSRSAQRHCPGIIVQGRYDLLCPPMTAQALAAAWRGRRSATVDAAGYSLFDPGVREAVIQAINDLDRVGSADPRDCASLVTDRKELAALRRKR